MHFIRLYRWYRQQKFIFDGNLENNHKYVTIILNLLLG